MTRPKVLSVVATRPNFMKIAPIQRELERLDGVEHVLVHMGQHYDALMSDVFLDELGIGSPAYFLGVGSGTHAEQLARGIDRLDPVLREEAPDVVLVAGDVNSTLAGALAAMTHGIAVGHVEAGLRSFDRSMPEELNRTLVDAIGGLLFTHSPEARENLLREGVAAHAIHDVGNTMIDTLVHMSNAIAAAGTAQRLGLDERYLVATLHRPSLVDDGDLFAGALASLRAVSQELPIVFPVHPRTRAALDRLGPAVTTSRLRFVEPLPYVAFLSLVSSAAGVLTDSGGIQEETTFLGVPCFTLRDTTERPITVELGTNVLLGLDPRRIRDAPQLIEAAPGRERAVPTGWDGLAAQRVVDVLAHHLGMRRDATLPAAQSGA
ncbi:MAG: non-hydrolyzing UDP-N-acetylglucosamine 2-epimerase [Gaiellaceae bacterium]